MNEYEPLDDIKIQNEVSNPLIHMYRRERPCRPSQGLGYEGYLPGGMEACQQSIKSLRRTVKTHENSFLSDQDCRNQIRDPGIDFAQGTRLIDERPTVS